MKKIILFFLFFSKLAFSQELINSIDINLNKIKNFYQIEDTNNNASIFILKNKENIEFIKTDEKLNISNRFEYKYAENEKSGDYIGNSFNNNEYYTYWKKNSKILEIQTINFSEKSLIKNEIKYPIESNEKIISTFSNNNLLYIISVTKRTSLVNFYILNKNNVEKKTVDCSRFSFLNSLNQKIDFWNFLKEGDGIVYRDGFQPFFLDKINYNSIHASERKKIYINNEKIIFSSDINNNFSQFVSINLTDFNANSQILSKNDVNSGNSFLSNGTNSFLVDDKVFIAKFSNEMISIIIKNFENNTLKTFSITPTEGHEYINSELIEEIGGIKNREIIKNEEKFLRRCFAKNPSISVYLLDEHYYLTIAGVSYPQQNSSHMLGMFGLIGGIAAAIINDGYSSSITSYSDKKIVYIKSSINSSDFKPTNFKNITSKFDDVRFYIENNNSKENFLTLFEKNNHFYLLAQKNKEEKVAIYKF